MTLNPRWFDRGGTGAHPNFGRALPAAGTANRAKSSGSAERAVARGLVEDGEFCEVFVDTALEVAEANDTKGLYAKARRGDLPNFTGIDSPYERPENPELRIDTSVQSAEEAADAVVAHLRAAGIVD